MNENYNRIKAETHDDFLTIEFNLIQEGYKLYNITGRLMQYAKCIGAKVYKTDIFMAFWGATV